MRRHKICPDKEMRKFVPELSAKLGSSEGFIMRISHVVINYHLQIPGTNNG